MNSGDNFLVPEERQWNGKSRTGASCEIDFGCGIFDEWVPCVALDDVPLGDARLDGALLDDWHHRVHRNARELENGVDHVAPFPLKCSFP